MTTVGRTLGWRTASAPATTDTLGELYDRYASMAVATAVRVVGGRDRAEDVVHDAFLDVWGKIDRLDASCGSLRGWLMTVVRNRAIDRARE
ncbi:MAG: hypothetical protein M3153_11110 [Chloroflexota bacterium]|nr:hypothetical protein [Chloroflexota bacterium]